MEQRDCRNCGAELTGEYCARCGQREGRGDWRFRDALADVFGEVFRLDSRLWRTLYALVLRPGLLTAEFNAGRRARYVPPFRLYLIISFLTFLVLSIGARLDAFQAGGDDAAPSAPIITIEPGEDAASTTGDGEIQIGLADEDSPQWLKDLENRVEGNAKQLEGGTGDFVNQFLDYLPQLMFLMLPLFALVVQLFYLFSGYHYLQHLVFGLNFHSVVYLLYLLGEAFGFISANIDSVLLLFTLFYLPLALRRVYQSSIPAALFKSLAIAIVYGALLVFGLVAITILTLALM